MIADAQMKAFVTKVTELIRNSPRERIVNMDEVNERTVASRRAL
jgi:hypothetical protein